ncbi:MAG: prepilin-type N-terminal cleavage/methylation domain-containing protein [Magnetococcales bacterium]|nr:prepilin-type N-terminal cleavage/methylation domain-containing protein [Magnetococcales bacterium]
MNNKYASGFSLIELSIVLVIIGIILSAGFSVMPGAMEGAQIKKTRVMMDGLQRAIEGYAIANNKLPCPATASGNAAAGTCNNTPGFIPSDIGLISDKDEWGKPIRYGVNSLLTQATSRSDFCTKLQTVLASANSTTYVRIAGIVNRNLQYPYDTNATNSCNTNSTHVSFVLKSSGPSDANRSDATGSDWFDGIDSASATANYTGCYDHPQRSIWVWGPDDKAPGDTDTGVAFNDNYNDIVVASTLASLVQSLNCGMY